MKVKRLSINKFHQFEGLEIDLTYPKGHEKEGKPLDKICFIGQSGTGKTTLLNIIDTLTFRARKVKNYKISDFRANVELTFQIKDIEVTTTAGPKEDDTVILQLWSDYSVSGESKTFDEIVALRNEYLKEIQTHLIYYPVDLDYQIPEDTAVNDVGSAHSKIYDFSVERAAEIWSLILSEIKKYQEEELIIRQDISKVAETSKGIVEIQRAVAKLEKWKSDFKNPVKDLAENCLNPVLKHFSLQVKTDLDITKKEDIGFIKIIDREGNEIPHALWSTGTKQVILSLLPLYLLKPNQTIILFDEPERSLYPDLQRIIIDFYLKQMVECQFIIATHSPLIAASFDPWEIVELKFNAEGKVYRELYYEGENEVKNYHVHPKYLTYELILKNVFDLEQTSSREREKAFTEFVEIRTQLEELKKAGKLKTKKAKELFARFEDFAQKLGWESDL